jgi:hypothetical protein
MSEIYFWPYYERKLSHFYAQVRITDTRFNTRHTQRTSVIDSIPQTANSQHACGNNLTHIPTASYTPSCVVCATSVISGKHILVVCIPGAQMPLHACLQPLCDFGRCSCWMFRSPSWYTQHMLVLLSNQILTPLNILLF